MSPGTPAKRGDHRAWPLKLYHNKCGKPISDNWRGYTCEGSCRDFWNHRVMDSFDDDAMATRFHTRAEPDTDLYAIVWVTEGKNRFTRLVPASEAHKHERFKL